MKKENRLTVHIKIKPFLKAFTIAVYGQEPIFFPKRDKINDLLQILLAKSPANYKPFNPKNKDKYLEVIIPYFEKLNINSYNFLSAKSQEVFAKHLKSRFWVTFEDFMDEAFRNNISKTDSIYVFMEKYNLPFDGVIDDMLRKAIYRSRRILQKYPRRKYIIKKKKN